MSRFSQVKDASVIYVLGRVAGAKAKHEYRQELGEAIYKERKDRREYSRWLKGNVEPCIFCSDEHRTEAWDSFSARPNHTDDGMCPYHSAKHDHDWPGLSGKGPHQIVKNFQVATKWMLDNLEIAEAIAHPKVRVIKAHVVGDQDCPACGGSICTKEMSTP